MSEPTASGAGAREDPLEEAIRLFNDKRYYDCHDLLEEEWAAARGPRREALKTLILIAAGMHHLQTSGFAGARNLLSRGLPRLGDQLLVEPAGVVGPVRSAIAKAERALRGEVVEFGPADLPRFRRRDQI